MRSSFNKVAILDCIGFDLQQSSRPMEVRFALCLVHDDGRVERQWHNDRLLCHRVTIKPGEDIDARMAMESAFLESEGFDRPSPRMIERIKAHCTIEWYGHFEDEMLMLPPPLEYVPFDMARVEEAVPA